MQVTQDELDQTIDQFKAQFGDKPSEKSPARSDLVIINIPKSSIVKFQWFQQIICRFNPKL